MPFGPKQSSRRSRRFWLKMANKKPSQAGYDAHLLHGLDKLLVQNQFSGPRKREAIDLFAMQNLQLSASL